MQRLCEGLKSMTRKHINRIRPDLKATLNRGTEVPELIIERILTPKSKITIALRAAEWQELMDWVRVITFLYQEKQA